MVLMVRLILLIVLNFLMSSCSLDASLSDLASQVENSTQPSPTPQELTFAVQLSSLTVTSTAVDQNLPSFLTVTLNQARSIDTVFQLSESSPDGANNSDYDLNASSVTVLAGQISSTIELIIKAKNGSKDLDKRVNVQLLTSDSGFAIQSRSSQFTITDSSPLVLTVNPFYPVNGANWNDYVDSTAHPFYTSRYTKKNPADYPSDIACNYGCVHGGEIRKVIVSNKTSCQNVTMSDSENAFEWRCADHVSPIYFYSLGFKQNKGLRNLLKSDGTDWKTMSVTLYEGSTPVSTSVSSKWWTNTVQTIGSADLNSGGSAARMFLNSAGRVYVVTQSGQSRGIEITADGISLVMLDGVTLTTTSTLAGGSNCTSPYPTCFIMTNSNRSWFEGILIVNVTSVAAFKHQKGGTGTASNFRLHNSSITQTTSGAHLHLIKVIDAVISDSKFFHGSFGIFSQTLASQSYFHDLMFSGVTRAIYNSGASNIFEKIVVNNSDLHGISEQSGAYGTYSNLKVFNSNIAFSTAHVFTPSVVNSLFVGNSDGFRSMVGSVNLNSISSINNSGIGLYAAEARTANTVLINNDKGYVSDNKSSFSVISKSYSLTVANNITNEIEFISNSADHLFYDYLNLGSIANKCAFGTGLTNIGLTTQDCLQNTGSSFTRTFNLNSASLYEGFKNDSVNTQGASGAAGIVYTSITDFFNFENLNRAWTKFHSTFAFPSANLQGICTATNCGIFDYSLKPTPSALKAVNGIFVENQNCPTSVNGSNFFHFIEDDGSDAKALKFAIEYVLDGVGNENGMCEANENCYFVADAGANLSPSWNYTKTCLYNPAGDPDLVNIQIYGL